MIMLNISIKQEIYEKSNKILNENGLGNNTTVNYKNLFKSNILHFTKYNLDEVIL